MLMHSIKMTIHLLLKKTKTKKNKKNKHKTKQKTDDYSSTTNLLLSTKSSQFLFIKHELLSSVTTIHIIPSKIGIWKQNGFFVT